MVLAERLLQQKRLLTARDNSKIFQKPLAKKVKIPTSRQELARWEKWEFGTSTRESDIEKNRINFWEMI